MMVFPLERDLAIISVHNKDGIVDFCRRVSSNYHFVSTGKTAVVLQDAGVDVVQVSSFTNYPEILDGRIKTLHPKILGGILGTDDKEDEMKRMGIQPIGLVVVNLYPFEEVVSKRHTHADAIENIDIGGVALLRAAAKNYDRVIAVSSPNDYSRVAHAIINSHVTDELRKDLARKAFLHTARYDAAIGHYMTGDEHFPQDLLLAFENPQDLRYGENLHQQARYYLIPGRKPFYTQIHGKEASYNNLMDFCAVIGVLSEHMEPTCAIIKHTSPCGVASAENIETAFDYAFATDNLSAFGSVMGFNRPVTKSLAEKLHSMFVDAIISPEYESSALEILEKKAKLILCTFNDFTIPEQSVRSVPNGVLIQSTDTHVISRNDLTTVSTRVPSDQEIEDLLFAWKIVKYAKSNAAVVSKGTRTLGIGMGQTSRIGAVELALSRAGLRAEGAVLASDAFFPYRDSIDAAAEKGITAVIAPSGSIRDKESINAANEAGIAFVWSKVRAFLH
jgi:phosphoribosylaminoimidazolecarboxamide formyltransferase/IMP cyclohydrolase